MSVYQEYILWLCFSKWYIIQQSYLVDFAFKLLAGNKNRIFKEEARYHVHGKNIEKTREAELR